MGMGLGLLRTLGVHPGSAVAVNYLMGLRMRGQLIFLKLLSVVMDMSIFTVTSVFMATYVVMEHPMLRQCLLSRRRLVQSDSRTRYLRAPHAIKEDTSASLV